MFYEPTFQPWQVHYLTVIGLATLPMIFAIVKDLYERMPASQTRIPFWLSLPALLGCLVLFTPYGWLVMWFLIVLLFGHAPVGAAIVGMLFTIFSFVISFKAIFFDLYQRLPRKMG